MRGKDLLFLVLRSDNMRNQCYLKQKSHPDLSVPQ